MGGSRVPSLVGLRWVAVLGSQGAVSAGGGGQRHPEPTTGELGQPRGAAAATGPHGGRGHGAQGGTVAAGRRLAARGSAGREWRGASRRGVGQFRGHRGPAPGGARVRAGGTLYVVGVWVGMFTCPHDIAYTLRIQTGGDLCESPARGPGSNPSPASVSSHATSERGQRGAGASYD